MMRYLILLLVIGCSTGPRKNYTCTAVPDATVSVKNATVAEMEVITARLNQHLTDQLRTKVICD